MTQEQRLRHDLVQLLVSECPDKAPSRVVEEATILERYVMGETEPKASPVGPSEGQALSDWLYSKIPGYRKMQSATLSADEVKLLVKTLREAEKGVNA